MQKQMQKQIKLKEFDEKLTEDDKSSLKSDLEDLRKAHADQDVQRIDETSGKLNETWNTISTRLYQESSQNESNQTETAETSGNGEVEDTDFEEVIEK